VTSIRYILSPWLSRRLYLYSIEAAPKALFFRERDFEKCSFLLMFREDENIYCRNALSISWIKI
jgi:hypothetical protein